MNAFSKDQARWREIGIVVAFVTLTLAPFLGKPFHIDEPLFLAPARHILQDPFHPLAFLYNWYGCLVPMVGLNNTPPLMLYALALGLKISGGAEWLMRLLFLPFDWIAAVALYLIAARFLRKPLLPVLIVWAGPAFIIDTGLLYPEKLAQAFGFLGLYAMVRAADEDDQTCFWLSAALMAAAVFAKYGAVCLLLPALGYALEKKISLQRLVAWAAAALAPVALYFLIDLATGRRAGGTMFATLASAATMRWAGWSHRSRALLAFTGGCGIVTVFWPFLAFKSRRLWPVALAFAAAALLFSPVFDLHGGIPALDHVTGFVFGFGALWGLAGLFWTRDGTGKGWALWAPWAAGVFVLLGCLYWSIMARLVALMIPPLVFAMAERLEASWPDRALKALYVSSLVLTLGFGMALAEVDYRYAWAQKEIARVAAERFAPDAPDGPRHKIWCEGHWGFQYYMESIGAEEFNLCHGGFKQVRSGDVVAFSRNAYPFPLPYDSATNDVELITVQNPIPLRLIGNGAKNDSAFYSSSMGFLPFAFSREPLDQFALVQIGKPPAQ